MTATLPDHLADAAAHPATEYARLMLGELGMPCDDDATANTPARFVRALLEFTAGLRLDPDRHFQVTFDAPDGDPGMVIVTGVPFVSLCEHHLLPFTGTAAVAYLPKPGGRIVGLSKLARVAQEYAARPQVQERLGQQIVTAIMANLPSLGAACLIESAHSCMTLRGARASGALMKTSHLTGLFKTDLAARDEFLKLAA